jgi:cytochrome c553
MSGVEFARALLSLSVIFVLTDTKAAAAETAPPAIASKLCQACHGAHGEGSPAASIPRLAGQPSPYLEKQLQDYASGKRDNPVMRNWAKQLSASQLHDVAAYYGSLTAVPYVDIPPDSGSSQLRARGHQLAHQGDEAQRVQACDNCHGPDGNGAMQSAPYLAGQSSQYLAATLKAWKEGTRKNDDGKLMSSVAERLNDADIAAIAVYFSTLVTQPN